MNKRIFVWFALASFAVAAAAASCSINRRSGQFECADTSDCDPGRVCSEGLCVASDVVPPDGPKPPPDAARPDAPTVCPPQCTSCTDGKVCLIDCAAAGTNCNAQITCPTGFHCDIRCTVADRCRSGINCTGATSCTLLCSGRATCRGVQCGTGRCDVTCTGQNSCENVNCSMSCACDVKNCSIANGSCQNAMCPAQCTIFPRGCSSMAAGCNDCP